MSRASIVAAAMAVVAPLAPGAAQVAGESSGPPGSEYTVYLMTMGQGDQVWERFGHNAIGIRDATSNSDLVFNWGVFSFDQPGFIGRFLRGEMMYWMAPYDAASTIVEYITRLNRTVDIQELNLSPAQRLALVDFIRWNARDENKFYRYDYFLDNCSTRVRDALDRVLGGAIRQATDTVFTGATYRDHALRLMAEDRLLAVGVDIGLGRPTDRPLTEWQEMFIPMKVRDYLRTIRVPDSTGRLVPLVASERRVYEAKRVAERDAPPALLGPLLVLGLAICGLVVWIGRHGLRGNRAADVGASVLMVVWLTVVGFLGGALVFLRTMTAHVFAYDNTNLLVYNPLWLVVAVCLPLARGRAGGQRFMRGLVAVAGVLTAFGVLALFIPGLNQDSVPVVLLAAPVNLAAAWMLRLRAMRPPVTAGA